ncbi:hypothetical protein C8R47DRAFT_1226596 [Mycena vitilis]|nr:hypothetical protein C8R47DRAFT_1226596 [Mycena vitilis]
MLLRSTLFLTLVWPGRSAPLEGGVTNPRALGPATLKVLMQATPPPEQSSATPPPFSPSDLVCTPAQLAYLQQGLANALALAGDAATHLSNAEACESEVVASFLCSASYAGGVNDYGPIAIHQCPSKSLSSPLQQVHTITTGDTSVYFQCATKAQQAAAKCGSSYALTGNRGYGDEKGQNIQQHTSITLCPKFFDQPTLDADMKIYLSKQKAAARGRWTFASPTDSGVFAAVQPIFPFDTNVVFRSGELFRLALFLKLTFYWSPDDNLGDIDGLQSPSQCSNSKTPAEEKRDNAENFALLGFLAYVDPGRFTDKSKPA